MPAMPVARLETLRLLDKKKDEIIFKMKLTSKEETEVLNKRIENLEKKLEKFEKKSFWMQFFQKRQRSPLKMRNLMSSSTNSNNFLFLKFVVSKSDQ